MPAEARTDTEKQQRSAKARRLLKHRCKVCNHPERVRIETLRLAGVTLDNLAARFGLQRDLIWRHMRDHVDSERRAQLIADVPMSELAERANAEGTSLLDNLAIVRKTVMDAMVEAATVKDRRATASLAGRATEVLVEMGRLTGEILRSGPVTNVTQNVAVFMASPAYANLEAMLIRKLQRHPEALRDVLEGLQELQTAPPAIEGTISLPVIREAGDDRAAA